MEVSSNSECAVTLGIADKLPMLDTTTARDDDDNADDLDDASLVYGLPQPTSSQLTSHRGPGPAPAVGLGSDPPSGAAGDGDVDSEVFMCVNGHSGHAGTPRGVGTPSAHTPRGSVDTDDSVNAASNSWDASAAPFIDA